jgi:hypothetical protein
MDRTTGTPDPETVASFLETIGEHYKDKPSPMVTMAQPVDGKGDSIVAMVGTFEQERATLLLMMIQQLVREVNEASDEEVREFLSDFGDDVTEFKAGLEAVRRDDFSRSIRPQGGFMDLYRDDQPVYLLSGSTPCDQCQELLHQGYGIPFEESRFVTPGCEFMVEFGDDLSAAERQSLLDLFDLNALSDARSSGPGKLQIALDSGFAAYAYARKRIEGDDDVKVVIHLTDPVPDTIRSHD